MITRGHLWRFVLGGSAVVALAACQGSDRAGPPSAASPTEVTASTSPTASPSATPTATDEATAWARVPEAARAHTYAGAQAFAEFYVGQINKAWTTPDPELLRPYGLPSCKSCANYVGTAAEMKSAGSRYESNPGAIKDSSWWPESTRDHVVIRLLTEQRAVRVVNASGSTGKVMKSAAFDLQFEVVWRNAGWAVATIRQVVTK